MKRYVPQQPQNKPDVSVAKARLRVAAVQAAPSAFIRRHPLSTVIGTAAGTFALTAIAKLFVGHSSPSDDTETAESSPRSKSSSGRSFVSPVLRSALSMGLPIIQSQLTKHFLNRTHEEHQQRSSAEAPGAQEPVHAVG
jgi:hypothetical protein